MPFRTAHAELRLETWQSYGAMAEQGGVCAAFARLMELQAMFDVKRGELWLERRKSVNIKFFCNYIKNRIAN